MENYQIELIWMDGKKHELFIGPVFPIKKEDEIIEEGIRLTMCFKDIKQGYYVRKTYVIEYSTHLEPHSPALRATCSIIQSHPIH